MFWDFSSHNYDDWSGASPVRKLTENVCRVNDIVEYSEWISKKVISYQALLLSGNYYMYNTVPFTTDKHYWSSKGLNNWKKMCKMP